MVLEIENIEVHYFAESSGSVCEICGGEHHTNFHKSSNGHKFTGEVRYQARELAGCRCTICGKEDSFDVHHMLAIWAFKVINQEPQFQELGLNKEVLRSIYNAIVVCEDCHSDLHHQDEKVLNGEMTQEDRLEFYRSIAIALLKMYYVFED